MRHRKNTIKLGRTSEHREALLANQVCELILRKRITTTVAKAKATRVLAEKMVTLGKAGTLAARRLAISRLRQGRIVGLLFSDIAPAMSDRQGGYTRIYQLGKRRSDGAEEAILEWVTYVPPQPKPKKEAKKGKPAAGGEAQDGGKKD